ncbi:MAG: hypothetical protein MI975_10315 [Cytophagales bacterium]|nr:hypothetical protein [Cytophagales bacterium]
MNEAEESHSFLERLKKKWGLKNLFQVIIILIVFSLTGMTVVVIRPVIFSWFGFNEQTPFWLKTITYILLIFPMYQILILVYGTLFGQFAFFWEKEKKLFKVLSRPFRPKTNRNYN